MKTKLLLFSLLFAGAAYSQEIVLDEVASGFNTPTEMVNAGDSRMFVVEKGGLVKILNPDDGSINPTPFMDISSIISAIGERGLLGLVFHPEYSTNGYFYIYYSNTSGANVVARYTRSANNADVADIASAQILLVVNQTSPFSNHNGGCLRFGPDGYLYIAKGDGGGSGDPDGNGQNKNTLLGKLLRIDVNSGTPYGIPDTNPFAGTTQGAPEIWAYGLRNPWKFSFDNENLWIADVGQNVYEEINKASVNEGGLNYGWKCMEGNQPFQGGCPNTGEYTMPFTQYMHGNGNCSITGGYVYRGSAYPNLQGKYLFADYCSNKIGIVNADDNNPEITFTQAFAGRFTTFGEDNNSELYIASTPDNGPGKIYKIRDNSALSNNKVAASAFSIYPNPANDVITVANGGKGQIAVNADIYDISGKLLISKKLTDTNAIAIDNLSAGLYMVNITDATGGISSHKLAVK